jgi:hypothetical protein
MSNEVRLDVGWRAGVKALTIVVGIVFALTTAFVVALVSAIVATFSPSAVWVAFATILSAIMLYLIARFVLGIVRAAARLEGTMLVVVGAFTTRRCDLAAADVSLDSVTVRDVGKGYVNVPLLVAGHAGRGASTRLRLRTMRGQMLPPDQLDAIASSIEAGTRPEPAATRSSQVAASLRQLVTGTMTPPV